MTSPCLHNCDNKTSDGYCRTTCCINPAYNRPVQNILCTSTCPISNNRISLTMAKELRNRIELAQMTNENLELNKAESQLLMDLLETLI